MRLPTLAPSSLPHSPSSRGSPRTRLSHSHLRASQIAVIALHGPREHLAHPLAQLDLLYYGIRGSAGPYAGGGAPWRVPRDQRVFACRRLGVPTGTAFAHVEPKFRMYLILLRVVVVQ